MELEYEVQSIIGRKRIRGKIHYLVKWKCCLAVESTWEPEEHLLNCSKLVDRYNNPQQPRKFIAKNGSIQDKAKMTSTTSDSEEEYEVQRVVAQRFEQGITQFLVKWKGYPSSQNTWEPEEHLKNAPILVQEFNARMRAKRQYYAFRSFKKQQKPTTSAFERGLMPEQIMCLINDGNQVSFLIKFLYVDDMEVVSADLAKANCPLLVEDFCSKINYSI